MEIHTDSTFLEIILLMCSSASIELKVTKTKSKVPLNTSQAETSFWSNFFYELESKRKIT